MTAVSSGTHATLAPTLGGRYYTDPAVLDAECERIFERHPVRHVPV